MNSHSELSFWHLHNQSKHRLHPPIHPTSYSAAYEFLQIISGAHGVSLDELDEPPESKLSKTVILNAKIEKQSAKVLEDYRSAFHHHQYVLANFLSAEYNVLINKSTNLAVAELLAGAETYADSFYFVDDAQAQALLLEATEWSFIVLKTEDVYPKLYIQGMLYFIYFCSVFPEKDV